MSNWGAKSYVGLTEVMLLDECNQRIEINPSFLRLDGAKNCVGQVSNLFNNRYRVRGFDATNSKLLFVDNKIYACLNIRLLPQYFYVLVFTF